MSLTDPDPWGRYSDEEPAARIVRPYTITAGRTRSTVDLPMEARLGLDPSAHEREWGSDLQGRIVEVVQLSGCGSERHTPVLSISGKRRR